MDAWLNTAALIELNARHLETIHDQQAMIGSQEIRIAALEALLLEGHQLAKTAP